GAASWRRQYAIRALIQICCRVGKPELSLGSRSVRSDIVHGVGITAVQLILTADVAGCIRCRGQRVIFVLLWKFLYQQPYRFAWLPTGTRKCDRAVRGELVPFGSYGRKAIQVGGVEIQRSIPATRQQQRPIQTYCRARRLRVDLTQISSRLERATPGAEQLGRTPGRVSSHQQNPIVVRKQEREMAAPCCRHRACQRE